MYTKYTDAIFTAESWQRGVFSTALITQISIKVDEMVAAGKTDGIKIKLEELYTVRRFWLDDGSAAEWITFVENLNEQEPGNLISINVYPVP